MPLLGVARPFLELALAARGDAPGALVWKNDHVGQPTTSPIQYAAAWDICERSWRSMGLPRFTPHDLRRSFASHLAEAAIGLPEIQALMGHENVATTGRYIRTREAALEDAVERVGAL